MITYCYEDGDGSVYEWTAPMGKAPTALLVGGRIVPRSLRAEQRGKRSGDPWVNHRSLALMMVGKKEQLAHMKEAKSRGAEIRFDGEGYATFSSKSQRSQYFKAFPEDHLVDRNSFC